MSFLKEIYNTMEKILHTSEPYEVAIKDQILEYYKIFGIKDFLKELDGCQYRYTINDIEFLIIRNKYKQDEYNDNIYYDEIILHNMKYAIIILPYDLLYNTFSIHVLYKIVNLTMKRMANLVFKTSNDNTSSMNYLNFMVDIMSIKILLFDLESERILIEKFSKEFINLINQSNIEQLSTFFHIDMIKELKILWETILNESNKIQ